MASRMMVNTFRPVKLSCCVALREERFFLPDSSVPGKAGHSGGKSPLRATGAG
jgi:hypothetical protein